MNRHGYEIPEGWLRVKLRRETMDLWSVVHQITGIGYGPMALKALGITEPASGLNRVDAIRVGDMLERALAGEQMSKSESKRRRGG